MTCVLGVLSFKISEICRICLRKKIDLINIYSNENPTVANLIMTFGNTPVNENDGLPNQICNSCDNELKNCYKFSQNIQRTYETLIRSLSNHKKSENEQDESQVIDSIKLENEGIGFVNGETFPCQDRVSIVCRPRTLSKPRNTKKIKYDSNCNNDTINCKRGKIKETDKTRVALQKFHKNRNKCPLCLLIIEENEPFVEHFYAHYNSTNLEPLVVNGNKNKLCNLCNKTFRYNDMVSHHRTHLSLHPFKCQVEGCDREFVCSQYLHRHSDHHNGVKKYQCQTCGKTFGLRSSLQNHEETHSSENLECKICHKTYKNYQLLKKHMKRHINGLKFRCTFSGCSKAFCLPQELNRHRENHTNVKRYICKICSKAWFSMALLQRHTRYHSAIREHQCEHCPKTFVEKTHLKAHELIHKGERPHVCEFCSATFITQSKLKRHQIKSCKQFKDFPS